MTRTDATTRRLRVYIWTGIAYLAVAIAWLLASWSRGTLWTAVDFVWLAGMMLFLLGVVHSIRSLPAARAGEVREGDERAQAAAGMAGLTTVKILIAAMAVFVGVATGVTGSLPLPTTLFLVAFVVVFFATYWHYLRRLG